MKCEEAEEEPESKSVEKFYQLSCFIEKGLTSSCQEENFKYIDISMKYFDEKGKKFQNFVSY